MSVMKGHTIVMRMPTVLMWWEDLTVPVTLDSLEMVLSVRVSGITINVHNITKMLITVFIDVNECDEGIHNCHENANCSDVVGGFNCTCNSGFTGSGTFCGDNGKVSITIIYSSLYVWYT